MKEESNKDKLSKIGSKTNDASSSVNSEKLKFNLNPPKNINVDINDNKNKIDQNKDNQINNQDANNNELNKDLTLDSNPISILNRRGIKNI